MNRNETLRLGNYSREVRVTPIPGEIASGFLYFNTNNDQAMKAEGVRLITEHLKTKEYKNPFLIAPESSMTGIVSIIGYVHNIPHYILGKQRRVGEENMAEHTYFAVTNIKSNTLYIPRDLDLTGYTVVIVDNVCTTGNTLVACYELLQQLNKPIKPIEAIVLFTEGEKRTELKMRPDFTLPITSFSHIPLYELEAFKEHIQYDHTANTMLPSEAEGTDGVSVEFHVFKHRHLDKIAVAYYRPSISKSDPLVVRVHDACITSEVFHSLKCDCRHQCDYARNHIVKDCGMLIYLFQEGRGIGLVNKTRAYNKQMTEGYDTVQANRILNLPDDAREYIAVRDILRHFKTTRIMLMTNNPLKVKHLIDLGIEVLGTVPVTIEATSTHMASYQRAKAEQMGHTIPRTCYDNKDTGVLFYRPEEEPYGFLSNFYLSPFVDKKNKSWPTVEHYYQAQKFDYTVANDETKQKQVHLAYKKISEASTPEEVYSLSREYYNVVNPEWSKEIRNKTMLDALCYKFAQNKQLYERLMRTGKRSICEDSPTDMYWGRLGENVLGKTLEFIRESTHLLEKYSI